MRLIAALIIIAEFTDLQNRLFVFAAIFFAAGIIAAVVCLRKITQPKSGYNRMPDEISRLQGELEEAQKEAQEANRAKSSFLANMSHEMLTPLNSVVGLSELILNSGKTHGEVKNNLDKIYSSGMTLLSIVNDILYIFNIESGKFELHPDKYYTVSLINDIVSLNAACIGDKPIMFKLTVDENLPECLLGDEQRIKQIFNNLLSNAFKFTNSGTVEWKISFEKDGDNIWILSDVKDTGIGIRSGDIDKVFKGYSQFNAQKERNTESTGLGLSITKRLVDLMDGGISAEGEYGKGMTFSVRLRQQFVSDVPVGKETAVNLMNVCSIDYKRARSAALQRIDLSYAGVLVVDDTPANLDAAKEMLLPYGLHVDCAISGEQAIDMIRAENPRYDIVFMDHMMPGMDGMEALHIIRNDIGSDYAKNVPVIALTANAFTGNEEVFVECGFQSFISKPINMMRLDAILRRWIGKKEVIHEGKNLENITLNS